MNTSGLSLEQAPPISIPFRFFLTASVFSLLAGLSITYYGEDLLLSRWSPMALGVTHLITLGFLAQVMSGAVVQLMPVLAGAPLPAAVTTSTIVHLGLIAGTLLLVAGFILSIDLSLLSGAIILIASFTLLLLSAGMAFLRSKAYLSKTLTLGLGWLALVPTLLLGLLLVLSLTGYIAPLQLLPLVDLHASWGLLGWVGIMLFAVMLQLLPMFYVTPEFPAYIRRWLLPLIFFLLLLLTFARFMGSDLLQLGLLPVVLALVLSASTVLLAIRKRKRSIRDANLYFLWTGMGSLWCAALVWISAGDTMLVGILILVGVCMSVPIGIIYKVIPFLCWFHLQSQQIKQGDFSYRSPSMKEFIPEWAMRGHYALHLIAFGGLLIAVGYPTYFARLSGLLFTLSSIFFFINLLKAFTMYRKEQRQLSARLE